MTIRLRPYQVQDLAAVYTLFKTTITQVNRRDYTSAQCAAWIGDETPAVRQAWQQRLLANMTLVAAQQGQIVGFGDITATGYVDCLFVAATNQGCGIATKLLTALEQQVPVTSYTTAASITARPFFEHRGYHVQRQQTVTRKGVALDNYLMVKS